MAYIPTPHGNHDACHYRSNDVLATIFDIGVLAREGCTKCMIIYESCVRVHNLSLDQQKDVRVKWNTPDHIEEYPEFGIFRRDGVIDLFPLELQLESIQLYFIPRGTSSPWNFIIAMEHILQSRRQEYLRLLEKWISKCNATQDSCRNANACLPTRVIDVGSRKNNHAPFLYISSKETGSYTALSHCWGTAQIPRVTKSNIQQLQDKIEIEKLPKNFQDAITVTRAIGIRYLWVDPLCIIQDCKLDWEAESSNMGTIYRDAYLVLAASQATDPSQGLLDPIDTRSREPVEIMRLEDWNAQIFRTYARRVLPEELAASGGIDDHRTRVSRVHDIRNTPLAGRAWTLQESFLARRIVYFTGAKLLWECAHSSQCGCTQCDRSPSRYHRSNKIISGPFIHSNNLNRNSTIHHIWNMLLRDFIIRDTTYESDRIPALSGLAKYFQSLGAGQYLAGFWRADLLRSLLWRTTVDVKDAIFERAEPYRAPTWSFFSLTWACRGKECFGVDRPPINFDLPELHGISATMVEASYTPLGSDITRQVSARYVVLSGRLVQVITH